MNRRFLKILTADSGALVLDEVEVARPDGKTVDVRLDENFKLVAVDGDSESNDSSGG